MKKRFITYLSSARRIAGAAFLQISPGFSLGSTTAVGLIFTCASVLANSTTPLAFTLSTATATSSHSALTDVCITGFTAPPTSAEFAKSGEESQYFYAQLMVADEQFAIIKPQIHHWMNHSGWQRGYQLWQTSRLCRSDFGDSQTDAVCATPQAPLPIQDMCGGGVDGYQFLVMHRHMLHTLRSLWPELENQFSGWRQWPRAGDYPEFSRDHFFAWPDAIVRAAQAADTMQGADRDQVLARWQNEGELGQWLQCGAYHGVGVNGLYGALTTNALNSTLPVERTELDLYLFWQALAWVDNAWENYRSAIGKTPDAPELQADIIRQCQVLQFWADLGKPKTGSKENGFPKRGGTFFRTDRATSTTAELTAKNYAPLYLNGEFNPAAAGKNARLLGEVEAIQQGPNGKIFLKLNLRLHGVKSVWAASYAPIAEEAIKIGERYVFVGEVAIADTLDTSGNLRGFLLSPTLLLVKSIQSPK